MAGAQLETVMKQPETPSGPHAHAEKNRCTTVAKPFQQLVMVAALQQCVTDSLSVTKVTTESRMVTAMSRDPMNQVTELDGNQLKTIQ